VCIDESNTFRLQHDRKVGFFDYHQRFLPLSHEFTGDKESFQKGKRLRANIMKMLGELKESQNGGFKGYDEKHN
jgi:hypothetical protein